MNKHIVVISQYYYPENFRINDICNEWVKRGYKVTVITGIPNYPKGKFYNGYGFLRKRREIIDGVNIVRLAIVPRLNNTIFLGLNYISFVISGWFWANFTRLKADIVFNFEVSPMTQALPAIWFAKRRRIPSIIYVQDLWPENLQIVGGINNKFIINRVNKMVDNIYSKASKILVTSESFKKSIIKRGVNDEKVVVWPQYAEDFYEPLKTNFRDSGEILNIIFTGNIGEAQGLDILPKVANELKKNGYNDKIKFTIVGDGRNKQNLISQINTNNVIEMFEFTGAKPAQQIPALLAKADVAFLSFSNNELFQKTIPAKLQSYMACGMPILAVAMGETEKIVSESNCGFVSIPGDIKLVVNNVLKFYSLNCENIKEMSENSSKYYKLKFNKIMLMDSIDCIMEEL